MNLKQLIQDYLERARMMQIATVKNSQPWVSTVYFAFDNDWNLYWISKPDRRHSKELKNNSKVAGVIVLPHAPGDKVRGLQFQGTAEEITSPDIIRKEFAFYGNRYERLDEVKRIISGENPHHLYKIKPNLFVLFDEVNFPNNPRQEYNLT